ncbi:flagellar hook-associated protein FlgL [Alicyclobacillus fastidiosus]|uniref:Flagellar hook-associated protein FlgL n=1 Tax=Alicyclobacillus fastidiosus TaxID=392011 RepID=A0ABY6ZIJ0_9BACL|nr:flagellar hook-associated protein FlgL [Alicyclobacillus fastidiosus]WAH42646.1 flagellar hook-associated protein FlgL [Alicyclobacillus fastidiosus]GMA64522.1 hypothetical protein GCM10025859_49620 [Alicyclobacillus fastidiosus]
MRVTQGMLTQQFLYNLSNVNQQIAQDQEEMSTGKSLNQPSDNPLAVSQDMSIQTTLNQSNAYQSVISSGLSLMQNTSSAVQSIASALQSIQQNVNQGLNATSDNTSQLQSLAETTNELVQQIYNDVDVQQNNQYVLSGTQVNVPASTIASGNLISGNYYDSPGVATAQGVTQSSPSATIATAISDPNGLMQAGQTYKLVFNASSIATNGSINSGNITLETSNGQAIASAAISSGTQLGASITLTSTSTTTSGSVTISLGNVFQVQDNSVSPGSFQQTDVITSSVGTSSSINYQVAPNVNVPVNLTAVGLFHTVAPGGTQDLQTTLSQTVSDLSAMASAAQSGDTSAYSTHLSTLQNDLQNLIANTNQVTNMNAELGTRIQQMNNVQSQMTQYTQTLTNQQSNLVDADMASVITKFSTDQTVYQAALEMGAKVLLPSLVNYLS